MGFVDTIANTYSTISKMALYNLFRTGDPMYDAIISTIVIGLYGYIFNYISNYDIISMITDIRLESIKGFFYQKNSVVLEGQKTMTACAFTTPYISAIYSNRFKAMSEYIICNIENFDTIHHIKESHSTRQPGTYDSNNRTGCDIFTVNQHSAVKLDDGIFVRVGVEQENNSDEKDKTNIKMDKMSLNIYSYVHSISFIKAYIENITVNYLRSVKESRSNSRFIYSLDHVNPKGDDGILSCWREDVFATARTFKNMFFDGKQTLVKQIDFFLENRNWYFDKGIPYSLGIGLYGPPGTGKTSFIKALAKHTNRHIIIIPLKLIKTKKQLENFFFENRYTHENESNSVTFEKKIVIFEDIDCIGDIVLDREKKHKQTQPTTEVKVATQNLDNKTSVQVSDVTELKTVILPIQLVEDPITLDDILNLWDGIRETPGRILIITSNHYNKLDPALTRPGRIDITHELSNASRETIAELYHHLFGNNIKPSKLKNINDRFYSPAELINIYVKYKNEHEFVNRLLENKKVV